MDDVDGIHIIADMFHGVCAPIAIETHAAGDDLGAVGVRLYCRWVEEAQPHQPATAALLEQIGIAVQL